MSPDEFDECRKKFKLAAEYLGWKRSSYTEQHERDWNTSWEVFGWINSDGKWLFSEDSLNEVMFEEIIKIAQIIQDGRI